MYLFTDIATIQNQILSTSVKSVAYNAFITESDSYLSISIPSVRDGGPTDCGGEVDRYCTTDRDPAIRYDYLNVLIPTGDAVRALGLRYAYDSIPSYAIKAIELIKKLTVDSNTSMEPNGNKAEIPYPIELYITLTPMLYGASFIMNYWETYEPSSKATFEQWVRDFLTSMRSGTNWTSESGNKRTWFLVCVGACASILNDSAELQWVYDRYISTQNLNTQFNDPQFSDDFTLKIERTRTDFLEGLGYSMYALNAMGLICELGRTNGNDLWTYSKSISGQTFSMENVLDFHITYLQDVTQWESLGYQQNDIQVARIEAAGIYELAYNYFGKPEYKQIVELTGRPVNYRVSGPVTLTHGVDGMALYEKLCGRTESGGGIERNIAVDKFSAMLIEYTYDAVTRQQIIDQFGLDLGEQTELDAILAKGTNQANRRDLYSRIRPMLHLAEGGVTGYALPSQLEAIIAGI